jgi:serine/threonine protein kinase
MARGLAAAHEKGVVHRDLKPENVFLTKDGRAKLLDFGLAKLAPPLWAGESGSEAGTLSRMTKAGVILGTVSYMSPKQVRGESVDHRSDIFSFGTIVCEMISGQNPSMAPSETPADGQRPRRPEGAPSYRPWAELLARTFAVDVLACPKCHGRMRLLAMVEDPANVARSLAAVGEATEVPRRSPGRGPPYWKSRVLRRQALGEEDDAQGRWVQETA